ncbi:hypothetical protein VOLCADRAFT_102987 [Volvox carteri f. nagariensis]|uniref:Vacuolar protein sorting-associated protein 13 VPS13 adaptor binding domain-containing protein n=1 Tax=Volvox carteri f. nagariensis TaxID=3068 RepID=D8TJ75_VOLCA|nr:uncharacterized protein VOLCADRAFT_102987 [Volvox carteri f. nagariensis]EFJ52490.1 hypothetical protein VOLCADRAFT_102987 [Volvox carteri f. nagariensis]|eukprot:XP_002946563.1 hypothetical protein VOLCADRAFT_102987 [Volvox carteri f. nagariensis]
MFRKLPAMTHSIRYVARLVSAPPQHRFRPAKCEILQRREPSGAGLWTAGGDSTETPDGQNVQPVVDDQLRHIFPERPAVVTLLRSNINLPTDEAAHLAEECTGSGGPYVNGECPRDSEHNCVRISFSMLQDGTMANEIELCHTLVQWPYLTEMSLVSSIIAIFLPGWGHPSSGAEALLRLSATPWFYLNFVLRNSQLYVPVLAPHLRHLTYGWRAAAAEAARKDVHLTPENLQQIFASMVDDGIAVNTSTSAPSESGDGRQRLCNESKKPPLPKLSRPFHRVGLVGSNDEATRSPLGDPTLSCNWATLSMRQMAGVPACEDQPKRLEQMGVVLTMAAFRVGYFAGGDGESSLKLDLRNGAGFVRHNSAQVTNWLLPIRSMSFEHRCAAPTVEESQVLQKYIVAARKLVFQVKRMQRHKEEKKRIEEQSTRGNVTESQQVAVKSSAASRNVLNDAEGVSSGVVGGDDFASVRSRAMQRSGGTSALDLLVEQATLRAAGLLELHNLPLPTSSAALIASGKLLSRQPAVSKILFNLETAVIRASFSNIPLWHALLDDVGIAVDLLQRNNGLFPPAPVIAWPTTSTCPRAHTPASEAAMEARATWKFRTSSMSVEAKIESLGFVLCDDKAKSYGAPDVLTAALEQVTVQYSTEKRCLYIRNAIRYYDHLPEQSGCISLRLAAQFLNNSTGRYVFVTSSELMKLTFHPSCLLTLGDTLSFVRRLYDRHEVATTVTGVSRGGATAPVAEDPPTVSEQMALSGSIMMRVPQRYLIQNLTGLMMSYWAPKSESDVQPASTKRILPSGCSEELQVTPTAKQVKIVGPGGVVLTRLQAQVIVLNFEGSWMPVTDVSVDVVGKYCYELHSPTDDQRAPVVVDVVLVGRTKILKIHSALFVQNNTNCRLSFRLHFPSVSLARQVVRGAGDVQLPGEQDIRLRPLKPGEGRYLPVVAALGGSLYLEARTPQGKGWCTYEAAQHDVIRLFPRVSDMLEQAGFIATGLPVVNQMGLYGNSPLHFAVKVRVRTRTEYSYTTFHSMEVPGPGLFAKASRPLEASVKICPTIVLTNSLPYYMEGYIISLNAVNRELEVSNKGTTSPQVAANPITVSAGSVLAASDGVSNNSGPPAGVSRRFMKIRRSETVLEETRELDEERIVLDFDALVKMLKPKAAKELQLRKVPGYETMTSNVKKCNMLARLYCELRWAAKRNVKEMDLLTRIETEPADRVTWQELDGFIEWARQSVRLVHVPPGEAQPLYLDMHKQMVLCIKVPELHLHCTRPVEVNHGCSTATNGDHELPDFVRLEYVEDPDMPLSHVLRDMMSRNHVEPARPLLQVVNQKFQDTAAAVGDRVANTVDKVANTVRDVFSGPHHGKAVQHTLPAESAPPNLMHADSLSYWQDNQNTIVRLQLLVKPGPWHGTIGTDCSHQGAVGTDTDAAATPTARGPLLSSRVADSCHATGLNVLAADAAPAAQGFPATGNTTGDSFAALDHGVTGPASPFARQAFAAVPLDLGKSNDSADAVSVPTSEQPATGLPSSGVPQPRALSSGSALPPAWSIFDRFRASTVGKTHDAKVLQATESSEATVRTNPRCSQTTSATGTPHQTSPGSVVHESDSASPICFPGASPSRHSQEYACQVTMPTKSAFHADATSSMAIPGASYGDGTATGVCTGDRLPLRTPRSSGSHRHDTLWSVNAVYTCGSSMSTLSGSDLPTRVPAVELHQPEDPLKTLEFGHWKSGLCSPVPGDLSRRGSASTREAAGGSGSSRPATQPDNQPAVAGHLSATQDLLDSRPAAKLSDGYAHLEKYSEIAGRIAGRTNRAMRRSVTLSGSPTLRRAHSRSLRPALSVVTCAAAGASTSRSNARETVSLQLSSPLEAPVGAYLPGLEAQAGIDVTRLHGISPDSDLETGDVSEVTRDGHRASGNTRDLNSRRVERDLPSISEAANHGTTGELNIMGGSTMVASGNVSSQLPHGRRWTADDVGNDTCYVDEFLGYDDFGILAGASVAETCRKSPVGPKSHSEKRLYGRTSRQPRERALMGRLQQSSLEGGVGKKGSLQRSFKAFLLREGRLPSNPMLLAKSAMQVVPRLPDIARIVGERIVDGGQQVIQGVPHMATVVADTIIAGGQGVKEKVVESTEQAIKIAKPKIKKGLLAMAWKATEAMRKRKQGVDGFATYDNLQFSRSGKHKNSQERAPKVLLLSLHNSLADKDEYVCHLTLYAPYWVDNRTGLYLLFKDLDAPAGLDNLPFLLWNPVRVPGDKPGNVPSEASKEPGSCDGVSTPRLDKRSVLGLQPGKGRRGGHGGQGQKPALLNDQARTRFCVEDHGHARTDFCIAFTIATINQKYSVDIKGEKVHPFLSEDALRGFAKFPIASIGPRYSRNEPSLRTNVPEIVSNFGLDRVNGGESPTGFSPRSSAQRGQVQMEVIPVPDGVTQRKSGPAADTAPKQQPSGPEEVSLSPQPANIKDALSSGLPPRHATFQSDFELPADAAGPTEKLDVEGSSEQRTGIIPLLTGEHPAYASSHGVEAEGVTKTNQASSSQPAAICAKLSGFGPTASADTGLALPKLQNGPKGLTVPEITPADNGDEDYVDDDGKGPPMTSMPTAPLPDIPKHGFLRAEIPSLPSLYAPNADTASSFGRLQGSAPAGDRLSSASAITDIERKGRKRSSRQDSNQDSIERTQSGHKQSAPTHVRRLYQFAVEVWAAPNDTVFGRTKVITVKNKYLILNATGLLIEYKQKGTPDPGFNPGQGKYGKTRRFSRRLPHNSSASWHWDDADAEHELVIRPAGDDWEWSGSFELPEVEDYFGLRIRHRQRNEYVIIPVNITVGAAGSVLVTLNSKGSVPPYMIINRCRDVIIRLKQADYNPRPVNGGDSNRPRECWDEIQPGSNQMPFAWDEPRLRHVVKVVAYIERDKATNQADAIDVDLDAVDANRTIDIQSRSALPLQLSTHAARAKLTDNAKKVYVTVYADGPTRVLCFSEDRSGAANLDDENSLLNLSYRLQRVASRLKEVDRRLVQRLGGVLDLEVGAQATVEHDGGSSQRANTASVLGDEHRRPVRNRAGHAAPSRLIGMGAFRFGALQMPSSGTATPSVLHPGGAGAGAQGAQFAFSRFPSLGLRGGSGTASVAQAPIANTPVSNSTLSPAAQPAHPSRTQSNQSHGPSITRLAQGLSPSMDGLVPLFRLAPGADDASLQTLEALPAYGGNIDLPVGGDLTVILRSVEGLSAGLRSNEKIIAVEGQMAVVSSIPGRGDVKASWMQPIDQPTLPSNGGSGGGTNVAGPGSSTCHVLLQDHMEIFRDVAASSELRIEFYVAKGTEQSQVGPVGQGCLTVLPRRQQLRPACTSPSSQSCATASGISSGRTAGNSLAAHMHRLAASGGQFAGCVRIPLSFTLGCEKEKIWRLALERKAGSQLIRGYVSLSFAWRITSEGMLVHEVTTLERILDEKLELLAQLNPMPISAAASFVHGPTEQASAGVQDPGSAGAAFSTPTAGGVVDHGSLNLGSGGIAASTARPLQVKKTAKALAESYYVNLELSILEIAGLLPREGLRATVAASMYGRQTASTMSVAMLPRAVVTMTCGGDTKREIASTNSVNPRFSKNKHTFENVPLGSKLDLKVFDQVSGSYTKPVAEAELHLSLIPGTDPIYAWVALARRKHGSRSQRMLALIMVMEEEGDAGVQLLLRIKINKPQIHGVSMAVTLDLAGIGLCAKTNLEELFNYTMHKLRAMLVQTRTEVQLSLAVQTIQLDNQMLEAKNPVVLSPADVSGSSSLAQARRRHMAQFSRRMGRSNPVLRVGVQDPSLRDPLLTCQVVYNQAGSNHAMVNSKEDSVGILAFRKVVMQLGPLDFSADQEFIEGVIAYLNGLPLEDFYQDKEWQLKIDAMQGGSMAPIGAAEDLITLTRQDSLSDFSFAWLAAKEAKEFELLRGQSSMWFYLEEIRWARAQPREFYLSDVFINVTLALSSSFNTGGSAPMLARSTGREDDRQRSMLRGFLSRVSGSNGFQLINVTNAPIQLEHVELKNHLVNRVSLVNKLYRHYSWIAIAQARKVLGGAGPAIAAIPASLLWASIALVDLGQDVAAKRVNPLLVPARIGYVAFTLMGQVIGVLSRTMCAVMGVLPPRFSSDSLNLCDSETARRFGMKPQTAIDALYLGQRDVVLGLMSAAFGFVHDTAAGGRWKGGLVVLGVPAGILKASLGLGVRPAAGAVEATSKLLQGIGLACLGKRGIQGKLVRRVQAPGLAITDVVQAARASVAQAAIQAALIAAWQAALPAISSSLADDDVLDVVAARATRVVLLTNRHLAYLYARRVTATASTSSSVASGNTTSGAFSVTYRVKWIIRNDHIDNIRGVDRNYAVSVEYHKPVKLGRLSLKLPLHRGMRTTTAEGHKDLIFRLNRHIGRSAHGNAFVSTIAAVTADSAGNAGTSVQGLRIMMPAEVEVAAVGQHGARGSQGTPR